MFYQFDHFGLSEDFTKEYGRNFNFPVHLHQSFELINVISGIMEITVDSKEYTLNAGESLLVFPNQVHSLRSNQSEHVLFIFSPDLVKAYTLKVSKTVPESNVFKIDSYILSSLDGLSEESPLIEKKGILYTMCSIFDKSAVYKERLYIEKELLYKIFNFVESNFNKDCSLEELSKETGYSYSHLSRFFKKITGISFNTYVNQHRIKIACYFLKNSDCSVLQCAIDCGYRSLRSFNRNFINFLSVTPKQFRENGKKILGDIKNDK